MVRELVGYGAAIKAGDVSGWVGIWGAGVFFFGGGGWEPRTQGLDQCRAWHALAISTVHDSLCEARVRQGL